MKRIKAGTQPKAMVRGRAPVPAGIVARWQAMQQETASIRRYIEIVTAALAREFKFYDADVARRAVAAAPDAVQDLAEEWGATAGDLVDRFPQFTLQTTFVATYSLLEDELIGLARYLGRHLDVKLDPEELSDQGIHAAKTYLARLCGIAFPESMHPWQEVLHYNRLRNVLAHRRGRVKKDDKKVRRYVESPKSVVIDKDDRLVLTKEFCLDVLATIDALMDNLFRLARDRVMGLQGPDGRRK
jgi:hypothetical protein